MKTIKVEPKVLALCGVKAEKAEDLTIEEMRSLVSWCDFQNESLWDGLSLQEILNLYRSTAEYENYQSLATDDPKAARKAWNASVNPEHRL